MTITETVDVTVDDIQLDLLVKPGDQADSVVDITWCISPRLRMELREQMIDDPHLLLVIVNNHEEMGRYVVPLDLGKWQIAFARGGKNTVLATVVWKNYGRQGVRRRLMRRRGSGSFNMSVIATDDPRVEMLHDQMQETQQTLDYKRGELSNLEDVIDPGAIEAPSDDADEAAQREFEIRVAIARLEADLEALRFDEGGGTPSREEQIEALRAEIATLEAEHLVLKAEYNQRSESPVREDRLLEEFDIPGNYYIDSDEAVRRSNRFGELDVEVSAQMFAKKPSKLWNWLGTYYSWPVPARDQCQMRRRVLFTLGTAWLKWLLLLVVGMLVEIVDLLLTGVLLLGGIRNINYEVLRHPLSNVPFDLLEESNRSFWFYKKSDEHWSGYERRSWALCFINPPGIPGLRSPRFLGLGLLSTPDLHRHRGQPVFRARSGILRGGDDREKPLTPRYRGRSGQAGRRTSGCGRSHEDQDGSPPWHCHLRGDQPSRDYQSAAPPQGAVPGQNCQGQGLQALRPVS